MAAAAAGKAPAVVIGNPARFAEKKQKFVQGGKEALQIITDFDLTLTRFWVNGKRGASSHGVIEHSSELGEEFGTKTHRLFDEYYPIEISPEIPREVKEPKMVEWWIKAHALMVEYGLKKHHLAKMITTANIDVRENTDQLLALLSKENVPVLIFSAGLSNILREFLSFKKIAHPNVHVVSNLMRFDESGSLMGFEGELIHSLNKNATILKKVDATWAHDEKRKNILLLGDNLTDIHMSDGLEYSEIISVGFLNDRIEERLEIYKQTFDVVIVHDGPMDFVLDLAKEIIGAH